MGPMQRFALTQVDLVFAFLGHQRSDSFHCW